jgi:hypothetical protein
MLSQHDKLRKYYEKNKNKKWSEWLSLKHIFKKTGNQGIVGILTAKDDDTIKYVFKISQYLNYLPQHELSVMEGLSKIWDYCPHFCRSIGLLTVDIDPERNKDENPLNVKKSKYTIEKEMILSEFIDNSYKFKNYIYSEDVDDKILYSTIKQVLLSLALAQKECSFTHYDLHSNNIMMKRCSRDLVFLYILDENDQFLVPTYGAYPVIIDFGFSYSEGMNNGPLWASLNHTEAGFTSDRFDPIADPKLFLVTVSDEIKYTRNNRKSRELRYITKNIYNCLDIDWESGWDTDTTSNVTDKLINRLSKYSKISRLFKEYEYYCIDILTSLIILPIEPQPHDKLEVSYMTFLKEFIKIENEISDPFFCIYILKVIVDTAREVRKDYMDKNKRDSAIRYMRHSLFEKVNSIAKYVRLKTLNFDAMLCALLYLGRAMEGLIFESLKKKMKKKNKAYENVPLKTPQEVYSAIEVNIEDDYEINENTTIFVIDNLRKTSYPIYLNKKDRDYINEFKTISKGAEIYNLIYQKDKSCQEDYKESESEYNDKEEDDEEGEDNDESNEEDEEDEDGDDKESNEEDDDGDDKESDEEGDEDEESNEKYFSGEE